MSTPIRIYRLDLFGADRQQATYRFSAGVNVVHGPSGSGKTSLLEAIRHAFGSNNELSRAMDIGVARLSVEARLGTTRHVFSRRLGENVVEVLEPTGEHVTRLTTTRKKGLEPVGPFLLDLLGLPEVPITGKRSGKSQRMSFWDIYRYCYVPGGEIDHSVVGHVEGYLNVKRKAVFELMLGLMPPQLANAEAELGNIRNERQEASQHLASIDAFLESTPSREAASRRIETIQSEMTRLAEDMQSLRSTARTATSEITDVRRHLHELSDKISGLETKRSILTEELESRTRLRHQAELDLRKLDRATLAGDALSGIEFQTCPRCLQSLDSEPLQPGVCMLCGQAEPPADEGFLENERDRLRDILREIDNLRESDETVLSELNGRLHLARGRRTELEQQLDERTRRYVSPRFEQIADLSEKIGAQRVELNRLNDIVELWDRRDAASQRVRELEGRVEATRELIQQLRDELAARRQRVAELSDLFNEIVETLEMPWYSPDRPARIDLESYLPIVNGDSFEGLSSGGMKVLTNVSYHLALLQFGLLNADLLIPDLLIIDSPRKALGENPADQRHRDEFYNWLDSMVHAMAREFQIIVADNDPPHEDVTDVTFLAFDLENPSVPWYEPSEASEDLPLDVRH